MSGTISIRRLDQNDSQEVFSQLAELHREAITEGFLSSLGEKFLICLYEALATGKASFVIVAETDKRVVGFIAGSAGMGKVYRNFIKRAGWRAIWALGRKLLSFRRIRRMLETLLYPAWRSKQDLPGEEIINFCVAGDMQRRGVGRRLFEELAAEFVRRGVGKIKIVTGAQQRKAQKFYEKAGAQRAAEIEVHKGQTSLVYVYDLPATAG